MAYVPGYEYDIFISYAHVDNICFPDQEDGWIKQFYQNLNLMLARQFGRMDSVKIWWDTKKLDGSVLFDDSIADGIRKSAIIICLDSPGYNASDYCKQELGTFRDSASADKLGLKVGDQSRILHVLLNNIPHEKWLEPLNGTTGFPFHDAETADDFGETVETTSPKFKAQMRHVKNAVARLLEAMKTRCEAPAKLASQTTKLAADPAQAETGDDDAFTIFMSEVPDTLRSPRKRLIAELGKRGYRVTCEIPPPDASEALKAATEQALAEADLAVNLLDIYPGRELVDQPDLWYPQVQTEICLQSQTPQMVWIPSDAEFADIEEGEYRNFLTAVEAGQLVDKQYEFIRGSKSSLAQQIEDYARQIQAQKPVEMPSDGRMPVLLDTHEKDHLYALDLSRLLVQKQILPYINPQEDDPLKNLEMLGNRMSQVRKLIFLYGNVSKEWVKERVNAALQLIMKNNYPVEDFFIYVAPPHKEDSDIGINQRLLKINMIDQSDNPNLNDAAIEEFLKELRMPA
ncbi:MULTISPECIES: toll/interleukin-1 receptor domain-containing protein [unclassified Robiginitalea]|uniref:toll/interleukin-1 receptor domain-containing protein n=1 Tax=Robiginitalea TaxID=252306 RepID=UPI00234AC08E|nr:MULTISPECIES: toll/interleukin-1 receptor domain-containing protein [unclassified Robiginitalea]MDC6353589.1 toll/interleukin-1 receptor domain-containing protein [Robiginitalea sp. PM2]MDC6373246.1 toll/interleukin-1 receptor domain-containing protein [Robiginitalea sp. SP8]